MSDNDYSSPKIWGPHYWYMMRCVAANFPLKPTEDDMKYAKVFYESFKFILPCELCKYSYLNHYNKHPIDKYIGSRHTLMEWVEIIYQETKKVISDKRVRIMDEHVEEEEGAKVKTFIKPKVDPIEEQLNLLRNSVIRKETNNRQIQVPPPTKTPILPPPQLPRSSDDILMGPGSRAQPEQITKNITKDSKIPVPIKKPVPSSTPPKAAQPKITPPKEIHPPIPQMPSKLKDVTRVKPQMIQILNQKTENMRKQFTNNAETMARLKAPVSSKSFVPLPSKRLPTLGNEILDVQRREEQQKRVQAAFSQIRPGLLVKKCKKCEH